MFYTIKQLSLACYQMSFYANILSNYQTCPLEHLAHRTFAKEPGLSACKWIIFETAWRWLPVNCLV